MSDTPKRRADDRHPTTPLRWGERWTLLLTGPNVGVVGQYGATWPGQPADYERVNVYMEGTAKLDDIEQYRLQMAAIGTASFGYWKEGDSIHPDYDTVPLRDVARLFANYDHLYKFREQVRVMVAMLKNREWAEDLAATGDAAELQVVISELVGIQQRQAPAPVAKKINEAAEFDKAFPPPTTDMHCDEYDRLEELRRDQWHVWQVRACLAQQAEAAQARAEPVVPDAVDAALTDAIVHGTGAFRVHGDGSTEHVDLQALNRTAAEFVAFNPPLGIRDVLYRDYVVPAGPTSCACSPEQRATCEVCAGHGKQQLEGGKQE